METLQQTYVLRMIRLHININKSNIIRIKCIYLTCWSSVISLQSEVIKRILFFQAVNHIEAKLPFSRDDRLGYLTFCPTNLGTTIRASVHIALPKLAKDKKVLDDIAAKFNLQVRGKFYQHTSNISLYWKKGRKNCYLKCVYPVTCYVLHLSQDS